MSPPPFESPPRPLPRVLAVDDATANLVLIRELLEPLALDLVTALSAAEAFASMVECCPDVVLLDRIMPGEDGLELLRRLHADPRFERVPVILQTACVSPQEVREGLEAGAAYYVTKPLDAELLRGVVRAALRAAGRLETLRPQRPNPVWARLEQASFEFRTLDDARRLAYELGQLCPNPDTATMGLAELMVNAIEHGNLEIGYDEKSMLCRADAWDSEIARRLELPNYRERVARVHIERKKTAVRFEVLDQGRGFDWRGFMRLDPQRAFDPNGRGIALANGVAFSNLHYEEPGNRVVAEVHIWSERQ